MLQFKQFLFHPSDFIMKHLKTGAKFLSSHLSFQGELTKDEVNFLRMIHILVRVACPLVRMYFDKEIHPDQLRKTLDENRSEMFTRYRKNNTIINDCQWRLLYGPYIGTQ